VASLRQRYDDHYAGRHSDTTVPGSHDNSANPTFNSGSPQKINFTSRYTKKVRVETNELEEYLKLTPKDFDTTDPVDWWYRHRKLYPNLYKLARDIMSIPGK
jgi:hypothetical protein